MKNISIKVGWIIITLIIGFVFPLAFIVTILLIFNVVITLKSTNASAQPKTRQPKYIERLKPLSVDQDNWIEQYREVCESPAEVSFLNAMIKAFNLEPQTGQLVGDDVSLQMQTPVGRYRLDFLVNDNLIVEVDGAEWHSSKEAVERDAIRDRYMEDNGFFVLRIAAKITLYAPHTAIDMVRKAIPLASAINLNEKRELEKKANIDNREKAKIREKLRKPSYLVKSVKSALDNANTKLIDSNRQVKIKTDATRLQELGVLTPESYFRERAALLHSIIRVVDLTLESEALSLNHAATENESDSLGIKRRSRDFLNERLQNSLLKLRKNSTIITPKIIVDDINDIGGIYKRFEAEDFDNYDNSPHSRPEAIAEYYSRYLTSAKGFLSSIEEFPERKQMFLEVCTKNI